MALDMDSLRESIRTGVEVSAAAGSALAVTSIFARAVTGSNEGTKKTLTLDAVAGWFQALSPEQQKKFVWCLFLDILGGSPELLFPGPIGEGLDGIWAPLYGFLLFQTFGARSLLYKTVLAVGGFLEELLPFVSIVPSATIGFLLEVNADATAKNLAEAMSRKAKDTTSKKDKDLGVK